VVKRSTQINLYSNPCTQQQNEQIFRVSFLELTAVVFTPIR